MASGAHQEVQEEERIRMALPQENKLAGIKFLLL
jgi:hypothetical protein